MLTNGHNDLFDGIEMMNCTGVLAKNYKHLFHDFRDFV